MGAFDDLIPAVEDRPQGPPQGHFDDLLPQPVDAKSFFADLIPKPDPGTIGPSTRGPIRRGLSYISRKLEPITPKNRGFPMLEAADIAAGRFETLLPGVDPETGRSIRSQATAEENAAAPTWAKIAAGGERGVATVAEALPPFLIAGAAQSGLAVPLLQRGISAAFAADMVRGLPDQAKSFIQAVNKDDVQGAVESFVGGTLGAYFTYKAATHAIGKTPVPRVDAVGNPVIDPKTGKQIVDFLGIAQESPAIRNLLTRKITEEISPQQMRDIYLRANQGKATPAEEELVRFVNQSIESPGEAIRKGVAVTEETPRFNNQWVNDYLGLIEGGKTIRLLDGKPVVVPAAQAESSEQRLIGGPNAPTQQSSMAETGRNQAESVPPVPSRASGAVQEPARAPEAQAPRGNVAPPRILVKPLHESQQDFAKRAEHFRNTGEVLPAAEPTPDVPAIPKPVAGERFVTIKRPDGTTYTASFGDKFYDHPKRGKVPAVGRIDQRGEWTHGMLAEGETIEEQPTEAQKEAGNYKKEHVTVQGLDVAIENKAGSVRTGKDKGGNEWHVTMPADYGYIKRTEGKDGDQVDVYVGPNPASERVFIVDQIDPSTGKFDEHKSFVGFNSVPEVVKTYDAAFSDNSGPRRRGHVSMMSVDDFKAWLKSGDTTKPFAYKPKEVIPSGSKEKEGQGRQDVLKPTEATGGKPPVAPAKKPKPTATPESDPVATPEQAQRTVDNFKDNDSEGVPNTFPAFRSKDGSEFTVSIDHEPRIKQNDARYFDDAGFWFPFKDDGVVKNTLMSDEDSGAVNGNTEAIVEASEHGKTGLFVSIRELDVAQGDLKKALQSKLDALKPAQPKGSSLKKPQKPVEIKPKFSAGDEVETPPGNMGVITSGKIKEAKLERPNASTQEWRYYIEGRTNFAPHWSGWLWESELKPRATSAPAEPTPIIAKGDWVEYEDAYGKTHQGKVDEVWTTAGIVPTRAGVQTRGIRHEFSIVDAEGKAMVSPKPGTPLKKIAAPETKPEEVISDLYEKANKVGQNANELLKRLKQAKAVLASPYRERFGQGTFDFEHKRLVSDDKTMALQWENFGKTSGGDVRLEKIAGFETKPAKTETVEPKSETKAPEGVTKAATDENLTALSDDEFDALLDEASKPTVKESLPVEPKKPEPKPKEEIPKYAFDEKLRRAGIRPSTTKKSSRLATDKEAKAGKQDFVAVFSTDQDGFLAVDGTGPTAKDAELDALEELIRKYRERKKASEPPSRGPSLRKPKAETPKTQTEKLTDAAKAIKDALDEAAKGLDELFGGGKHVGSGPSFDEETYRKAKPHFDQAWENAKRGGGSILDFLREIIKRWGEKVKPYLRRWREDLAKGTTNETSSGSNVVGGTRPPKGTMAGEAGGTPENQPTEGASGSGGKSDVGDQGETPEEAQSGGGGRGGAAGVRGSAKPGLRPGQTGETPAAGGEGTGAVPPKVGAGKPKTLDPNAENHVIKPGAEVAPKGAITKLRANIDALMLLRELEASNRNATPEEKDRLASYTGWGSLSQVFDEAKARRMEQGWNRDEKWEEKWGKYYTQLKQLLTDEEWRAAARSTQYAHFTSVAVIKPMWDAVQRLGFFSGKVLEPAVGVGHFFGLAPETVREDSKFIGIDQDAISARIATKLYPQAKIFGKSFGDVALPPNSVDVALTNVPFSDRIIKDANYPLGLNLHNWYIAKMLDAVKPGGLVVTITSGHTMDSQSAMRKYLASRSELVGAIRLPNTAFKENAGTEVTTDILFLRKPMTPTPQIGEAWIDLKPIKTYDGKTVQVNEYFANHPEMIAGRPSLEGTMHAGKEEYATLPFEDKPLAQTLKEAVERLPRDVFERTSSQFVDFEGLGKAEGKRDKSLVLNEGALAFVNGNRFTDPTTVSDEFRSPLKVKQAVRYVALTESYRKLIGMQNDPEATTEAVEAERKNLNTVYDAYVKHYGPLNSRVSDYLSFEASYYLALGLEKENITIDPKTEKASKSYIKADVFSKRTQMPTVEPQSAASISDAVPIALSFRGRLDVEYMGKLLGVKPEEAERQLLESGGAFKNPETGLLETPDAYLSGNVRKKLAQAKSAAAEDAAYKTNVEALEKVQPPVKPFRKIRAFIGSTWIPPQLMTEFARSIFQSNRGGIQYNETSDMWIVGGFSQTPQVIQTYGTGRRDGEDILAAILNQKTLKVYDEIKDGDSTRRVLNEVETQKVAARADKLQSEFQAWLRKNEPAQQAIEKAFNEAANNYVERKYEIARLDLPGASHEISFRANQRNAVWRFVQELHGLVGHTVGAGKTMIYIATAMEARRLGLAKKPMIAVLNSTLGQFAASFRKLYPTANVLVGTEKDFETSRRKQFMARIASGDYDAIIIPHSQFNMLPDDPAFETQMTNELLDELRAALAEAQQAAGDDKRNPTVKQIEKQIEKLEQRIAELANRHTDELMTFQDLGVDLLIVDEAHEFKKPPFVTKRDRIAGLSVDTSKRAFSLFLKARYIQSRRQGKGVILGTGTPVTNTLGEAWHMLNIASPHILRDYKVDTFDRFLSTFTLISQEFDVNAVGTLIVRDKLSRFVNLPQLVKMIRSSWDIITQDDLRPILEAQGELYPKLKGGKVAAVVVPRTAAVKRFADFLMEVYTAYKQLDGAHKRQFNYIPVMAFLAGKAAALDIRLVDRTAADDPGSKLNAVVADAFKIWSETKEVKLQDRVAGKEITAPLTQAIFIDQMNPFTNGVATLRTFAAGTGVEYNASGDQPEEPAEDLFLYNDIKKKLIKLGVPESQILIVNEHDTKKPEAALMFDRINRGEIRIVIGSTAKMGVGVNMQRLMYKLHHVDVPWFPALLEQRNGRIERPGNLNPEIEMAYYGMEKTADVGLYAKNESKAKWAQQILSGRVSAEESEDPMSAMILTMQEQMAQLSGDPLLFEKVQLESRIRTLRMQREAFEDDQYNKKSSKKSLGEEIVRNQESIATNTPLLADVSKRLASVLVEEGKTPVYDATIARMKYTTRKDVLAAMESVINQHRSALIRNAEDKAYKVGARGYFDIGSDDRLTVGTINGLVVRAGWTLSQQLQNDEHGKAALVKTASVDSIWFLLDNGKDILSMTRLPSGYPQTADGALRSMNEIPARLKSEIDTSNAFIERANKEIEEINRLLTAKFAGEQELAEAEERYRQLREMAATGNTPQAAKLADELFAIQNSAAPLLIRLRRSLDAAEKQVAKLSEEADPTSRDDDQALVAAEERVKQIVRRLNIVEKARLEGEFSGDAELLGYGLTPSTRPGIRYSRSETVEQPVTQPEAESAVRELMGDIPDNVRFINDPTAPRGEIVMIPGRRGEIELNLAKLGSSGSVKDTVLEELVHGVQNNRANNTPEVNSALDAIDSLVTEVDRQRKSEAGYNPDETQEEAANERARRIFEDADKANIFVRAWRAIVKAFKDLFGIKLSEAENARSAAKAIITEALKNKPTAGSGRRGAEPTAAELRKQRRERAIETGVEEKWIPTQVGGTTDYVRGREQITPLSTSESLIHARNIFNEAGIEVTRDQDAGGWRIVDRGYDQSAAGRLLADILKREIRNKNEPGKAGDLLASLLNSVVYNFKAGSMANFDTPTRQELYSIAQSDRSARGLALGALAGFGEDLQFVAQNVDVVLNRIWSDRYGGEALTHLLDRVVNNFRGYFTNAEIAAALKENRDAEQFISRLIALNRKDEGGRVYRRVQALLKPKQAKTLAKLEADARIEEAVNEILAQASRQGIEPRPTPGKPLPALHKLLLLVSDKNAAAIDRLIANAVSNAERNAGIAAQLKAATSPEELEEWQQRFAEGEDPSAEMVEEGLDFPQFSHWRDIRDNLLDYSPITLKLVQDVVRGSFKGTVRGKPVQKQDVRLDLNLLAKSPEQAVAKALDEYLTIVQANMDLEGATPETQARIEAMLRQEVESQLEAARKRFRSKMFTAPLKPGEKLSDEQRMAQLLNAGLFRDENLNIPEMVERAVRKSQFQRLNPSVAELIKQVFATPFYRQQDLATEFAAQMVRRFGVPEEQADKAAELFAKAFASRFAVAREKAAKAARETITPQEMQSLGMKKSVWRRIEQAVNSGLFDTGSVLREIAAEHHWKAPTDEQVAKMKQWSEEEQRLRELTPEQRARIGDDPAKLELARLEKEKVFEERRTALKKKIEAEWARITRPLALPGLSLESYAAMWEHRKNNAAALNELASANILLKAGFIPRQFISVLTQGAIHTPTRAMAHALINHAMEAVKGAPTSLLDDIQIALRDSYKVRLASLHSALYATRAAFLGRGEARNVDRLMSSIGAIERIVRKADEAAAAGRPGEAMMYRLMSLIRLGYRVAQAFDNLHGLPAEYQEMVLQVENGLRQLGMNRAQIEANKHRVFGTMEADWVRAIDQARIWFESEGITPTSAELHESAWILVKAWQYERIRDLGLPADDFQERNRLLRSTVGWNERETRGLGGLVGSTIGGISQAGESMGIPLMVGRFGNAIAISINRSLMFTPASGLSNAFGPGTSAWHTTEADRLQRKFEMGIGSLAGLAAFLAVLVGAVVVRLSMPRDPEERALWEKQGIKPNTVEFHLGNGSFIPFSLNTGPMAPLAPYFAAGGALHDLAVSREKAQAKLNSEAAKRGVAPGKINPISIGDQLAVAAAAAQGVIMGGRTAAGLLTSVTDYGVPNSQKLIASQLSPLVPGLPALQEVSRMAGVTLDAKMATVWDFMLPLPTSQARKVNLLGDPAGTPNDLQRIIQVLTAGTYPGIVNTTEATEAAAYGTLYESGYRPPSIDPNKGYAIGGEYRPLSPAELANYTVKRGQYLKAELMNAGPTADPKIAAAAYQRANERALSEIGVEAARPVARAVTASPLPLARRPRGYRGSSLRRRRPSMRFSKGPSLRLRRSGLRLPSNRVRTGRGGSLRRPRLSAFR